MNIAVLGATGRTGRPLVEELLRRGHTVAALARDPAKLTELGDRVRVVTGTSTSPAALDQLLTGTDAVVSALGPSAKEATLHTDTARALVAAMARHGVTRFVGVSGAGIDVPGDRKGPRDKAISWMVKTIGGPVAADKQIEYAVYAASDLDWTLVRPPRLLDGPPPAAPTNTPTPPAGPPPYAAPTSPSCWPTSSTSTTTPGRHPSSRGRPDRGARGHRCPGLVGYPSVPSPDLPRPVAFALGGGAAYGAVHVGMLRALAEVGITPDLVVGTSVGSLNGSMLAADPSRAVERLAQTWPDIRASDVFPGGWLTRLRTLQASRAWLSPSTGIAALLDRHLDARSFDELALPFGAVAADFATAAAVTLTRGDLHQAILASSAIPGVLPPVEVGGRSLVDGGILANVPVRQAVELGAASVMVLDCGLWGMAMTHPTTLVEVMLRVAAISVGRQLEVDLPRIAQEHAVVYLPGMFPMTSSPLDFSHHSRLMAAGYTAAKPFLSVLRVDGPGLYGTPPLAMAAH